MTAGLIGVEVRGESSLHVYNVCADGDSLLQILENDTILRHDSVWPYGLNFRLSVTSLVELAQFRTSCRRHQWPKSRDSDMGDDDVTQSQGRLCQRLRIAVCKRVFTLRDYCSVNSK